MGTYVETNLGKNETIVKKAELNPIVLVVTWIGAILFCWLLLIPVFKAIVTTLRYFNTELAITNKRVVGKVGVLNTMALDAPLNKIQNVSVSSNVFGKIFNYGTVVVNTASGQFTYVAIKNIDQFKGALMAQIDQAEEDKIKEQAQQMANAMSSAMQK